MNNQCDCICDEDEGEIWESAVEFLDDDDEGIEKCEEDELECSFRRRKTTCDDEFSNEEDDEEEFAFSLSGFDAAKEQAEQFVKKAWEASWNVMHFKMLPEWLQDNDFVCSGYRPPLPSVAECFKSIFRLHTETGNIWTHMIGCVAFLTVAISFITRPGEEVRLQEKIIFSIFFVGVVGCLGLSCIFHTLCCHSERVGKLVLKLDYVGITLLIICSFIPWLFYGFYCHREPKITYTASMIVLGIGCIIASSFDKFSEPSLRPVRAGLFILLALCGVIPAVHYIVKLGFWSAVDEARLDWLLLMAALYVFGTALYAMRIPERFFPGKFDIWFQSHQLFHLFVIIGAFVHYQGISEMAVRRLTATCTEHQEQIFSLFTGSSTA